MVGSGSLSMQLPVSGSLSMQLPVHEAITNAGLGLDIAIEADIESAYPNLPAWTDCLHGRTACMVGLPVSGSL
jgi:hypothetical protein